MPTGSGKSQLLEALRARGEQVLHLEQLARLGGDVLLGRAAAQPLGAFERVSAEDEPHTLGPPPVPQMASGRLQQGQDQGQGQLKPNICII